MMEKNIVIPNGNISINNISYYSIYIIIIGAIVIALTSVGIQ